MNAEDNCMRVPMWFNADMRPEWLFPLWARKLSDQEIADGIAEMLQLPRTRQKQLPPGPRRRLEVLFIEQQYRKIKARRENRVPGCFGVRARQPHNAWLWRLRTAIPIPGEGMCVCATILSSVTYRLTKH